MRFLLPFLLTSASIALANPWNPEADLYLRDLDDYDLQTRDFDLKGCGWDDDLVAREPEPELGYLESRRDLEAQILARGAEADPFWLQDIFKPKDKKKEQKDTGSKDDEGSGGDSGGDSGDDDDTSDSSESSGSSDSSSDSSDSSDSGGDDTDGDSSD